MLRLLLSYCLFLTCCATLAAQTPGTTDTPAPSVWSGSPVFVDLGVGLGGGLYGLCGQANVAAGYRFNLQHGLGLEWRTLTGSNGYNGLGVSGFGLRYRYQRHRFIFQAAAGKVTNAYRYTDFFDEWEYTGTGRYLSGGVDYQFRWGGTVGLHFAHVAARLDHYRPGDVILEDLVFAGTDLERSPALTLTIGYAFPRQARRPGATPPFSAAAQTNPEDRFFTGPLYLDAGIGWGVGTRGAARMATVSAGYRFDPRHALGLEWRGTSGGDDYLSWSASGLGLRYRYQYGLLLGHVAGGLALGARYGTDYPYDRWEFTGRGTYLSAGLGHQFRWGGTVGLQFSRTVAQLDYLSTGEWAPEAFEYESTGKEGLSALTLTVGYAFPRQP